MPKSINDDDSFLGRWSRNKRAQAVEQEEPQSEPEIAPETIEGESHDEDVIATLPALDDLTEHSDIRVFLQNGVPKALRNAALRRKWMLVPGIRDHKDPAVDYAWDWNTPGGVPGDGAAPSPERAAQMLRDLIMPHQHAQKDDVAIAAQENSVDSAAPQTDLAQRAPDLAPPDEESSLGTGTHAADAPDRAETASVARRRHGGALPT
ncbi:MAG: DUF3306 domain-containing protein [Loktanella sp.]|nr:DUF3306 domain-containing protein [Loktanella sp.]